MLSQAVESCPAEMWDDPAYQNRFWHVAYHAIFYTHLYLHPRDEEFTPWEKQRENYNFMGRLPFPPHTELTDLQPYTPEEILEYAAHLDRQIPGLVASLDLESADSGFSWLPLDKFELQLYTIRHLQHHAGELFDRLGREAGVDVPWVGTAHD
jgi:hypothetical protein